MRIAQKAGWAAALLLCATAPLAAGTGVVAVVVPVSGMTCALCTRGVEESVRQADGVDSVHADLGSGRVRVEAAEGRSLDIRQVKERVQRAGFKVAGECDVTALGRFAVDPEGKIAFRIGTTPVVYQVLEGYELRRLSRAHPGLKGDWKLTFRLHEHPNWKPAAISILAFEPAGVAAVAAGAAAPPT